jgi:phosphate transport system substrate-binding protein
MRSSIRALTLVVVSGWLLSSLSGCERAAPPEQNADSSSGRLSVTGAGSSFAAPIFTAWMKTYGAEHPELGLSYESVGSSEGVARFVTGKVDIGATDAPIKDADRAKAAERAGRAPHQIPVTGGMIAVTYNVPAIGRTLNLPRDVYADIFLGRITRWDDPRIAAANPGTPLPAKLIQVVARQDGSGTTFAFTNHLAAISADWAAGPGVGNKIDWPGGAMLVRGNEGVSQRVKLTEGSIGYVEAGFARRLNLPMAWLENRAGGLVLPQAETGSRALAGGSDAVPDDLAITITDPEGSRSYPIVTFTWALLDHDYNDPAKTQAVRDLVRWMLVDGQQQAADMGYVPLPQNLVGAALAELDHVGG